MSDPAPDPAEWYVSVNGERSSPLTLRQVIDDVARGDLDDRDFAWREGMADWLPLPEVALIDDLLLAEGIHWPDHYEYEGGAEDSAALRAVLPIGRTFLSIAAGYLGLFALFLGLAAPVAIPVSILAIRQLKKHPEKRGMGRAVFGLVGSAIGIAVGIAILIARKKGLGWD